MIFSALKSAPKPVDTGKVRALLWAPDKKAAIQLASLMEKQGFPGFDTNSQNVVGVYASDVSSFAQSLGACLDLEQRREIKALIINGSMPKLDDFAQIQTVENLVHHHSTLWLADMLNDGRFKSLMQPIVEAEGHAVHGYEFLFRGMSKDGQIISPVDMFAAATDGLLSARLDSFARDSAVRTASYFDVQERLFINVLPRSVSVAQSAFTDTLDLIENAGVEPARVVFEIVESEAVNDIAELSDMINFCRSAGYRIALDDFGSGFNNLTMLIGLSPDYIKLDKSLISRVSTEPPIWNLVANMIDAAKQSGVLVIAEGVEDERTARLLRALGTDFIQGYLTGRPAERPL